MFTGYKTVNTLERGNKDFHDKSYFYVDNFVHNCTLHQTDVSPSFLSWNIPNPAQDKYRLTITDISGKVTRIIDNVTNSMIELERDNLSRGFYLIELRGDKIYQGKY